MRTSHIVMVALVASGLLAAKPKPQPPKDSDLKPKVRAMLFNDVKFEDKVKGRFDDTINFDFGAGTPDPAIKKKNGYSIRWVGWLRVPKTADYDFGINLNGGVKLFLDDEMVVDYTTGGTGFETHKKVQLDEGLHKLKVEYFNKYKNGHIFFKWQYETNKKEIVPASAFFHEASGSEQQ